MNSTLNPAANTSHPLHLPRPHRRARRAPKPLPPSLRLLALVLLPSCPTLLRSHHTLLLLPSDPTLLRSRPALLLLHSCPKIQHSRSALLLLDSPTVPRRLLLVHRSPSATPSSSTATGLVFRQNHPPALHALQPSPLRETLASAKSVTAQNSAKWQRLPPISSISQLPANIGQSIRPGGPRQINGAVMWQQLAGEDWVALRDNRSDTRLRIFSGTANKQLSQVRN
ncbi:unnamed protein product [Closterium sp. NIES-54]